MFARFTVLANKFTSKSPTRKIVSGADSLPAYDSFKPRQQFQERKGLGDIIITPGAQACDPVINFVQSRQKYCGRHNPMCTQSGDYVDAVAARKHAVDDEHIESAGFCKRESIGEIRRACCLLTELNQALDEDVTTFKIILDYENSS